MKGTWWWRKTEDAIAELFQRIWIFGPAGARANLMINAIPDYSRPSLFSDDKSEAAGAFRPYDRAVISGFDLAMSHGSYLHNIDVLEHFIILFRSLMR